jgi:glycopeptide antibiotics resistance protein
MPDVSGRARFNRVGVVLSALVLAVVLVATLTPAPASTPTPDFWCIACGEIGPLDVLNNIVMFVPLGLAFALASGRRWWSVLACVVVTMFVEAMQFRIVTGRDSSLSDLVANSLGGLIGVQVAARGALLVKPRGRAASVLAVSAAALFALITTLTSTGFRPASIPRSLWVQWTPERASFEPFSGQLLDFKLDSIDLPRRFYPPTSLGVDRILRGPRWEASVVIGTEGLKPQRSVIARIAEEFTVLLSVEQSGWNLVCEEKTRSGDFGFRSPKLAVRDVLMSSAENASERVRFTCARADGSLAVSAGDRTEELRLSPSLGWLLVYPFNGPAPSGYVWFSVVWLIALAFPAGYWIRCVVDDDTTGRSRSAARRARSVAIGAIAIAFGVGLVLAPLLAGTAPAAWWEWVSAVLGVAAGALAGSVSGRLAAVWESRLLIPRRSAAVAPASDTPR